MKIEKQIIDGKQATIAYLSANFALVEQKDADLVKVMFDNGQTLFLTPAINEDAEDEFKESEHPRGQPGNAGQFGLGRSSKGENSKEFERGTYYHSSSEDLERGKSYSGSKKVIWLSDNKDFTDSYGQKAHKMKIQKNLKDADLTYSSPQLEMITKEFGAKVKNDILKGNLWRNKSVERKVIERLLRDHDVVTLFDSKGEREGEEGDFHLSKVIKNPQENIHVAEDAEFKESEHPRGQPGNAGQFGPGGGSPSKGKQETEKFSVKKIGNVNSAYTKEIESALGNMPKGSSSLLKDIGVQVKVSRLVTDSLSQSELKGWPPGTVLNLARGIYLTVGSKKVVVVSEIRTDKDGKELVESAGKRAGKDIINHEMGHAIDDALNRPSANSASFITAYGSDSDSIKDSLDRKKYAYFLQSGKVGRSEVFAELWNSKCGGKIVEDIRGKFPKTAKIVDEIYDEISNGNGDKIREKFRLEAYQQLIKGK